MRITRALRLGIGFLALAAVASGCTSGSSGTATQNAAGGKLTIGIKFDQPGLGLEMKNGTFSGFDVDVATYVAGKLGVKPANIVFREAPSAQRETLIQNGAVDMVVASYSITDQREKKVDFAGPYYIAGQSLLVRADNTSVTGPQSLGGKKLCTVKGSTSAQDIQQDFAHDVNLLEYDTYSLCVEALKSNMVDAVTTDNIILAGYVAQNPGQLKLVGTPFTTERYGIGLRRGDKESRDKVNDAIQAMLDDNGPTGWRAALVKDFGPAFPIPTVPQIDRY